MYAVFQATFFTGPADRTGRARTTLSYDTFGLDKLD